MSASSTVLKEKLSGSGYQKIVQLDNEYLNDFLARYISLCAPKDIFVCDDSKEAHNYIREKALKDSEEEQLALTNKTVHFDGYYDQARDKKNTKFLLKPGETLSAFINSQDYASGIAQIEEILQGIMQGHTLYICFFCLGPLNSPFSLASVQLTDSAYVAHSESILYRSGYSQFLNLKDKKDFFKFVHSQGELDSRKVSKNIQKRRVFIDLYNNIVYSTNTQYGGNTIGLKKLALRLAINKASREGWLAEHMFLMGLENQEGGFDYFTGAYPSMCGKTSTALIKSGSIVGDDIAYIRNIDGYAWGVNVEKGIFGIIHGVNKEDDPLVWNVLHDESEVIFSNILVTKDKIPWWHGKDNNIPKEGNNFSGEWFLGKTDEQGNEIPPSHKNARFTVALDNFPNVSDKLNASEGVKISAIIYGGRDSDTSVPVEEAFDWAHGVITKGAALESETTAATLGQEGIRVFNPMSNLDFLSIPIGKYINGHLNFGKSLEKTPLIFSVNYFLKDSEGNFLNSREDKLVWLKWMQLRVHNKVKAIKTPTGLIPFYQDLEELFNSLLGKKYSSDGYVLQFSIRVNQNIAKIERITNVYHDKVKDAPEILFQVLSAQKKRLEEAKGKFGEFISPFDLEKNIL